MRYVPVYEHSIDVTILHRACWLVLEHVSPVHQTQYIHILKNRPHLLLLLLDGLLQQLQQPLVLNLSEQ